MSYLCWLVSDCKVTNFANILPNNRVNTEKTTPDRKIKEQNSVAVARNGCKKELFSAML
jgi:hypothetical protein